MSGERFAPPPAEAIAGDVAAALAEDIGSGDVTADLLPTRPNRPTCTCKEDCVLAGRLRWLTRCTARSIRTCASTGVAPKGDHVAKVRWSATLWPQPPGPAPNIPRELPGSYAQRHRLPPPPPATSDAVRIAPARASRHAQDLPGLRLAQKIRDCISSAAATTTCIGFSTTRSCCWKNIRVAGSVAARSTRARAAPGPAADRGSGNGWTSCAKPLRRPGRASSSTISTRRRGAGRGIAKSALFDGRIPLEVSAAWTLTTLRAIAEDGVDCISIGGPDQTRARHRLLDEARAGAALMGLILRLRRHRPRLRMVEQRAHRRQNARGTWAATPTRHAAGVQMAGPDRACGRPAPAPSPRWAAGAGTQLPLRVFRGRSGTPRRPPGADGRRTGVVHRTGAVDARW